MTDVDRIVRPVEAEQLTGLSNMHLSRLERAGQFPQRFKLVEGTGKYGACGWRFSTIMGWIDERAASVKTPNQAA